MGLRKGRGAANEPDLAAEPVIDENTRFYPIPVVALMRNWDALCDEAARLRQALPGHQAAFAAISIIDSARDRENIINYWAGLDTTHPDGPEGINGFVEMIDKNFRRDLCWSEETQLLTAFLETVVGPPPYTLDVIAYGCTNKDSVQRYNAAVDADDSERAEAISMASSASVMAAVAALGDRIGWNPAIDAALNELGRLIDVAKVHNDVPVARLVNAVGEYVSTRRVEVPTSRHPKPPGR